MSETTTANGLDGIKDRMNALRAQVTAREKAKKDETARRKRVEDAKRMTFRAVIETLQHVGIMGLAAWDLKDSHTSGTMNCGTYGDLESVVVFIDSTINAEYDTHLVAFALACDHDGMTGAWLEHDGDRVSLEIAVQMVADLAEKHFYVPE